MPSEIYKTEPVRKRASSQDLTRERDEVSPRHGIPVLDLDRLQDLEGLVQVRIVGPSAPGEESDLAAVATPASVGRSIRAGTVPREPDEERRVVA